MLIGKSLADDTLQQAIGAVCIVATQSLTVGVAEFKFSQVAVQVVLVAILIDSAHTALEDAKISLDGVGGNVTAHVFAAPIGNELVRCVLLGYRSIEAAFIGG